MKPFIHITKKSRQKFKYLENERAFKGTVRLIFANVVLDHDFE